MTLSRRLLTVLATIAVATLLLALALGVTRSRDKPKASPLTPATVGSPIEVGGNPVAVAVGAGAVWVIDAARQTLTMLNPHTRDTVGQPRRVAGGPFAVAVGAGAVWVAAADGAVRAYDPHTVRPVGPPARVPGANGLAVGGGGVWVSSRRAGTVTRIDARTHRTGRPISVGRGPADIAIGFDAVWVANADGASISRIDPRRGRAVKSIAVGARQVLAVAVGDGAVWAVRAGGPDADRAQLVHIDPQTDKIVGRPIRVPGAIPLDLAAHDGVWVTDSGDPLRSRPGHVLRLDAAAPMVTRPPLRVGTRPSAIALGEGTAWVTNQDDGTLTPITFTPAP
jgi:hypothetical protein